MKKRTRTPKRKTSKKKCLGRYASSIEKYCADQLKQYGLAFDYEEHTFQLTKRFKFPNKYFKMTAKGKEMADRSGSTILPITYKPDFVGRDHSWIIETKGYLPSHHDFPMRWKLFLGHLVANESNTIVFLAKNSGQVDAAIQEILQSIKDGDI
jgi:glutamine cyclotransferase